MGDEHLCLQLFPLAEFLSRPRYQVFEHSCLPASVGHKAGCRGAHQGPSVGPGGAVRSPLSQTLGLYTTREGGKGWGPKGKEE